MIEKYSYRWYIQQFDEAKSTAEKFILSIEEPLFLQPPSEGRWSIAECYSHLIKYGDLYLQNMEPGIADSYYVMADEPEKPFPPRWIVRKIVSFFEPPYKMKVKTLEAMKPNTVSGYNRMELLDEYIDLQDRFITQLEKGRRQQTDLSAVMVEHPIFSILKMTLSECFALAEVHQRRHQWQAEQTRKMITESHHR